MDITSIEAHELRRLFVAENKTAKQIAQIYGCTENQVKSMLNAFNVRKAASQKCKSGKGHLLTKENLHRLYHEEGLNFAQIAEHIGGISRPAIAAHFQRKGIPYDRKESLNRRRIHPNSIEALREHRPRWETYSKERQDAFKYSKSPGRLGQKHTLETRRKMSKARIMTCQKKGELSKTEKAFQNLLLDKGLVFTVQEPITLVSSAGEPASTAVDFFFDRTGTGLPWDVACYLDSRYHHNKDENVQRDALTNLLLVQKGHMVMRLWDDETNDLNKFLLLWKRLKALSEPAKICFHYPEGFRLRCPKSYVKRNTTIEVHTATRLEQIVHSIVKAG